ncbi:MAG: site-2 protease family protein, partial [Acholeplasmatales bacterium]|nr:site-2 protease family protein [Acholeplasmatales bacterium]
MILVKIIVFILVLSVIIVIHELGHFLTAKKYGVLCHEFSVGMGPAIYKKKKGETTFAIRAIPFGGYVSMAGEQFTEDIIKPGDKIGLNLKDNEAYEIILDDKTVCDVRGRIIKRELYSRHGEPLEIELCLDDTIPDAELSNQEGVSYAVKEDAFFVEGKTRMQLAPFDRCLESKKLWQRFIVMFAGPFMNMVLAIFIYLLCYFIQGTPMYQSTTIGEVADGYAASEVLEVGDKIMQVNGVDISSWYDYKDEMQACIDNGIVDIVLTINRDGEVMQKTMTANVYVNSIGISNVISTDSKYYTNPALVTGAIVGDYGLRYKDDVSDDEDQISTGDIITAINVTNYGDDYSSDNWVDITSWSDLINQLKDLDVANIYFRYNDVSVNDDGSLS